MEDIINCLKSYEVYPKVVDPWATKEEVKREYGIELTEINNVSDADCIIFAVAHNEFKYMSNNQIDAMFRRDSQYNNVVIDIKKYIF